VRPGVGGKGHEDDVLIAAISDLPAGGDPFGIGVENDLQEDAGIIGWGAGLIVLITEIENGKVYFVVDEVMKRVLEGAGEDLFVKTDRDEFALRIVVVFVLRHTPPVTEGF